VEQPDLLRFALDILDDLEIPYALVGSIASGAYGEPRLTQDINVVVDMSADQAEELCSRFPETDFYVSSLAARKAVQSTSQFNILDPSSGNKIDVMIAGRENWRKGQLDRRRPVLVLPGRQVFVACPEDVILGKLEYYDEGGSEKHLRDIAGIIKVSGDILDRRYIEAWAAKLGLTETWQAVLRRAAPSDVRPDIQ